MSAVFLVCHGLSSCCSSIAASFECFFTSAPQSHSLYPSLVWACVLGFGAFLFPPAFLPCRCLSSSSLSVAYPYAVHGPLAAGQAFHFCWLLAHSSELCQSSVGFILFLQCLLAFVNSFPYVGFSLGPLGFLRILGIPPLIPPRCRLVFSFRYHLPPPLPPAIGGTCSLSLSLPHFIR